MSGQWRKAEGRKADTVSTIPFELPDDAYDLAVPNALPHAGPPEVPVVLPRVEHEPVRSSPVTESAPRRPRVVRVKAIRRRQPMCDHSMMSNMYDFNEPMVYEERQGSSLWTCLGAVGFVGTLFMAYNLYRSRKRRLESPKRIRHEWILDSHGTLHRAQIISADRTRVRGAFQDDDEDSYSSL